MTKIIKTPLRIPLLNHHINLRVKERGHCSIFKQAQSSSLDIHMECTRLFNELLRNEKQVLSSHVHPAVNNTILPSQPTPLLRREAILDIHGQARKASNIITKLESRCGGVRTGGQADSAMIEQLIAEAEREISQINTSRLKDDLRAYYSGVSTLLEQRLQAIVAKYRTRTARMPTSTALPVTRMTLADFNGPSSLTNAPRSYPEQLMMEQTLYPSLTIIDHSQQANAQSVAQTLHEVQQLYKQIAATVQHDGERILGLHETIDTTTGVMEKANGFVQKTYALSRKYHKCVALVLLVILAWIIVRGAIRRI